MHVGSFPNERIYCATSEVFCKWQKCHFVNSLAVWTQQCGDYWVPWGTFLFGFTVLRVKVNTSNHVTPAELQALGFLLFLFICCCCLICFFFYFLGEFNIPYPFFFYNQGSLSSCFLSNQIVLQSGSVQAHLGLNGFLRFRFSADQIYILQCLFRILYSALCIRWEEALHLNYSVFKTDENCQSPSSIFNLSWRMLTGAKIHSQ